MSKESKAMSAKLELIFADTNSIDFQHHLKDILAEDDKSFETCFIETGMDGVELISATLNHFEQVDTIHIIADSHNHKLALGTVKIDEFYLERFMGIFNTWTDALSTDAELKLYGHNHAALNKQFINKLKTLTKNNRSQEPSNKGSATLAGLQSTGTARATDLFQLKATAGGTLPKQEYCFGPYVFEATDNNMQNGTVGFALDITSTDIVASIGMDTLVGNNKSTEQALESIKLHK